jgi:restriction system protein
MTLWLARCGRTAAYEQDCLDGNFVGIGWAALGDLTALTTREQIRDRYLATYAESEGAVKTNVAQVYAFRSRIEIGDLVALPLKGSPVIAFGRVTADYRYAASAPDEIRHQRGVRWIDQAVPRSNISQDLLYSLGAFLTVCQIDRNDAEARITALLAGTPMAPSDSTDPEVSDVASTTTDNSDLEQLSLDQIRTHLEHNFKGHDLARLIGWILEAQGYTVEVSPPGPDNGVDVLASPGQNGFGAPRVAVQVKSGKSLADEPSIRDLQGTMQNFGATHGIFVSWSGFNNGALRASRRSFFSLRLWNADDVIREIFENYDALPALVRARIPLRKVWTLIPDDSMAN